MNSTMKRGRKKLYFYLFLIVVMIFIAGMSMLWFSSEPRPSGGSKDNQNLQDVYEETQEYKETNIKTLEKDEEIESTETKIETFKKEEEIEYEMGHKSETVPDGGKLFQGEDEEEILQQDTFVGEYEDKLERPRVLVVPEELNESLCDLPMLCRKKYVVEHDFILKYSRYQDVHDCMKKITGHEYLDDLTSEELSVVLERVRVYQKNTKAKDFEMAFGLFKMAQEIVWKNLDTIDIDKKGFYRQKYYRGENVYFRPFLTDIYSKLVLKKEIPKRVIDVAAAFGSLLMYIHILSERKSEIYAVDFEDIGYFFSPVFVEEPFNFKFYQFALEHGDYRDQEWAREEFFDWIIMTETVEHFTYYPSSTMIKIRNLLNHTGMMLFSTPKGIEKEKTFQGYTECRNGRDSEYRMHHIYDLTREEAAFDT